MSGFGCFFPYEERSFERSGSKISKEPNITDMIVPYNSEAIGKTIAAINIPPKALVVLIARGDKFIVPNGSTVIEGGDVFQVLANDENLRFLQGTLATLRNSGDM